MQIIWSGAAAVQAAPEEAELPQELRWLSIRLADAGFGHERRDGRLRFHRAGDNPCHIYPDRRHGGLITVEDTLSGAIRTAMEPPEALAYILRWRPKKKSKRT